MWLPLLHNICHFNCSGNHEHNTVNDALIYRLLRCLLHGILIRLRSAAAVASFFLRWRKNFNKCPYDNGNNNYFNHTIRPISIT